MLTTASFVLFHFACAARADFCLSTTGVVVAAAAAADADDDGDDGDDFHFDDNRSIHQCSAHAIV